MGNVSVIYAIVGDGEDEGIWGYNGLALICSDAPTIGPKDLSVAFAQRLEAIKRAAAIVAHTTGKTWTLRKFKLVEEGN